MSQQWIFTFGHDHVHPVTGASLANCYVVVEGDVNSSRETMAQHFGTRWSTQYRNKDEAGVEKYGLYEIPLPEPEPTQPVNDFDAVWTNAPASMRRYCMVEDAEYWYRLGLREGERRGVIGANSDLRQMMKARDLNG